MQAIPSDDQIGVGTMFQYLGTAVQVVSATLFYLILVRYNTQEIFGAISLLVALIGLFNIILTFGLNVTAQHFVSYYLASDDQLSARNVSIKLLFLSFMISIIGLLAVSFFSVNISSIFFHTKNYSYIINLLTVPLFGNVIFGILNGILLGMQRFKISAFISILTWISYYFLPIILTIINKSIELIILGWSIGIFEGLALELIIVINFFKNNMAFKFILPTKIELKYTIPLFFSSLVGFGAVYVDRFIVAGLMNLAYLALYNFSLLFVSSLSFIAIPLNNILLTKFSELLGDNDRNRLKHYVSISMKFLSFIYVPLALILASLIKPLLLLLAGREYLTGTIPAQIIIISSALFISLNVLVQALSSIRLTRVFIISSSSSLVGNLTISILLIPKIGIIGAALGYSSVYALTFFILLYFVIKEDIYSFDYLANLKIWVSGLLPFVLIIELEQIIGTETILIFPFFVISVSLYLIFIRVLKTFKSERDGMILKFFPARPRILINLMKLLIN